QDLARHRSDDAGPERLAEGLAHSLCQSLSGTIRALLADLSGLGDHDCHELVAEIDAEARRSSKKLLAAEVVPLRGVADERLLGRVRQVGIAFGEEVQSYVRRGPSERQPRHWIEWR